MELFIIGKISVDTLMKAISWTLLHSLWQGLACSFLAALILMFTKKTSPQVRYNLLTAVFFLFLLINGLTLVFELREPAYFETISYYSSSFRPAPSENRFVEQALPLGINGHDYVERFSQFMNEHSQALVVGWFLIFCFQFLRLLSGVGYIQRIRSKRLREPGSYWLTRIRELAVSVGIKENVRLMQSELAKVPMVAGYLKPIILVPIQMMIQLSGNDIEAILLHELAHIRRRDFLVNVIQRMARLFYFFNPGLLWISSVISEERENCCDELAIETLGNKKAYISALLSFEEMNQYSSSLALAFPGRKNRLLLRVRRILYHQNQTLNTMEKMILAVCLFLIGLGPLAFSQAVSDLKAGPANAKVATDPGKPSAISFPAVTAEIAKEPTAAPEPQEDTLPKVNKEKKVSTGPKKVQETVYEINGYRIVTRGDQIISAYENGKKLSPEEINKQKFLLQEMIKKQNEEWSSTREFADAAKIKELTDIRIKEAMAQAENNVWENEKMAELLARDAAKMKLAESKQMKVINEQLAELLAKDTNKMNLAEGEQMDAINKQMAELQHKLAELQTEKINLDLGNRQAILEKLSRVQSSIQTSRNFYPIGEIVDMLKDKQIIDNNAELSFELNNDAFIVNKVKQPASIHEEFKKAFLKSPQDHVIYSVNKNSSQSDVSIKD